MKKALTDIHYHHPVKIYHAILDGLEYNELVFAMLSGEDGIPTLVINGGDKKLPKSPYILMTTPFSIDGMQGDYAQTRMRLDMVASTLGMHFGNNYLWELMIDGILNAHDSKIHLGKVLRLPSQIEGPALHPLNWTHTKALFTKIKALDRQKRSVVELALTLLERGVRDRTETKFFHYWVALEVLCGTNRADVITNALAKYYKCDKKAVCDQLYWKKFFTARHNYFHKGIIPKFDQTSERYAQLLFLDLLRYQLGMKNVGHLLGFLNVLGHDPFALPTTDGLAPEKISEVALKDNLKETDAMWEQYIKDRKL